MSAPTARPISQVLNDIQAPVRDRLDQIVPAMVEIMAVDVPQVQEVNKHLLKMRGKLFRPTLALLSSAIEGNADPRAVKLAASIELMHLATLVHDDSVDHSVLRRGLPTVNSVFSHEISVIMGDLLYSRALGQLVRLGDIEIVKILTDVTSELAIGEMRQLAAIERLGFTEDAYLKMIRAKTASLLSAACETGAICGAPSYRQAMARYGDRLGTAFQIADDILDYTENSSVTGKPGGLDLKEHKVTLPLIAALPKLSSAGRAVIDKLFATEEPSDAQVAQVVSVVAEAGGIDAARRRGDQVLQEAEEVVAGLPESSVRASLADAIAYVMERRS
jgi:octaprenyl-diphosphate synthase